MTYQTRKISVTISLSGGSFSTFPSENTLVISDAKIIASQQMSGGLTGYTMEASIYGLSAHHMAVISGSGFKFNAPANTYIKVDADGVVFFEGIIVWARPDYNQSPDIPLQIQARAQPLNFNKSVTDTSIQGSITLKDLLSVVGGKAGLTVGVCQPDITLSGIHLNGNVTNQLSKIQDALRKYRVYITYDLNHVNAYTEGSSASKTSIELNADNGLVGYPTFTEYGLFCTAIYNPKFIMNGEIKLETSVPNASGDYVITFQSAHQISSWVDNGPFFSTLLLMPKGGISGSTN